MTFAHRGFAPSDPVPGGPDAADYAGDLAALIDHLEFSDVRLVAQSMGGWTMLEYAIAHPARVKALVLSSTSGTLDRRGCDPSGGGKYDAWLKDAEAKIAAGAANGIHPAMGAPAAARSPALHLLYRSIDDMAGIPDKEEVRAGLRRAAGRTLADLKDFPVPTLLIAGGEDVVFPPFLALNSQTAVGSGYFSAQYAPFKILPSTAGIPNTTNTLGQTRFNQLWSRVHERLGGVRAHGRHRPGGPRGGRRRE